MSPAEIYAQKREEAVELIRTHAPERLQEPLIELLRPAIALSASAALPMCWKISFGQRGTKSRSIS